MNILKHLKVWSLVFVVAFVFLFYLFFKDLAIWLFVAILLH